MAAGKSKGEQQKQILAAIVAVLVLGFLFREKIFGKAKTTTANTRGGVGTPVAGGAPPVAGVDQNSGAPAVTPAMIPVLSPEIVRKITNRRSAVGQSYPEVKLSSGINPFIPYNTDLDAKVASGDGPTRTTGGKKPTKGFNRKLTFWGAFTPGPDEPKRVIIEVQGDPQPWTGSVGEMIDGTPYRVKELRDGDLKVILENPTNAAEKPFPLTFEGSKEDKSSRSSDDKGVDALFGGKNPEGGDQNPDAQPSAGGVDPAYDR